MQAIDNYVISFLGQGTAQRELTPEEREKARQKLYKNWDDDAEEAEMGTGSAFIRFRFPPHCRPSIWAIFERTFLFFQYKFPQNLRKN